MDAPGSAGRTDVESRWPLAAVLGSFIVLTVVLRTLAPRHESLRPHWLVPGLEIALLLALIAANPTELARRSRWLRPVALTLIFALAALALLFDAILIRDLVTGAEITESPSSLLASGALVWLGNAVVFSLLYWELDSGGPLARHEGRRRFPDFAFSQQLSPELAPPGWRPRYVDYLILGVTTSTAFSPTDVMPMTTWAKLAMAVQSLISLTVIGLVVARAVNAFS